MQLRARRLTPTQNLPQRCAVQCSPDAARYSRNTDFSVCYSQKALSNVACVNLPRRRPQRRQIRQPEGLPFT
jgi:hypothetical protein